MYDGSITSEIKQKIKIFRENQKNSQIQNRESTEEEAIKWADEQLKKISLTFPGSLLLFWPKE
ncbi:MAG: hypothetical protein LBQ51_01815 [Desulfovibrio sp.]|jgi:hypothetical protein|nr:hypothetical protein [Desulfovibrio sp.]